MLNLISLQRLVVLMFVVMLAAPAVAQLRIVTYNTNTFGTEGDVADLPSNFRTVRTEADVVFQAIGEESVNGIARPADIILLQEQQQLDTTTDNLVDRLNAIYADQGIVYARGVEVAATTGSTGFGTPNAGEIRQAVIYRTDTVQLIEEDSFGNISGPTQPRETLFSRFRPVGFGSEADLYIFNSHFEAGDSTSDLFARESEATDIRDFISSRGLGNSNIIVAGDLNVDSNFETSGSTAFGGQSSLQILAAGTDASGRVLDPVFPDGQNVTFNNNAALAELLTQSPSGGGGGLVGGGIDDRFDFVLQSDELLDGEGVASIEGSLRAFGNNGSTFNDTINDGNTIQIEGLTSFTTAEVLDALEAASDHLPVVEDFQLPAIQRVTALDEGSVAFAVQGTDAALSFLVENVSPVEVTIGADELDFTFEGSGLAAGSSGTGQAFAVSDGAVIEVGLDTSQVGAFGAGIQVSSDSFAAVDGEFTGETTVVVLAESQASFSANDAADDAIEIDLGRVFLSDGQVDQSLTVFSPVLTPGVSQAGVDLTGLILQQGRDAFELLGTQVSGIAAGGATDLELIFTPGDFGLQQVAFLIGTADDASFLGAEMRASLLVTASVELALAESDLDANGTIDEEDFVVFASQFGATGLGLAADFDLDQDVDEEDFVVFASQFGLSGLSADSSVLSLDRFAADLGVNVPLVGESVVPEPATAVVIVFTSVGAMRRARHATRA